MSTDLSCVEHFIPIEICLIDMCFNFRDSMIHTFCVSLVHNVCLVHSSLCVWLCTLSCSCCVSVHIVTLSYA